ncbi:MAG: hypothetical protein ACI91B_002122, partial [Planctomycetota bacterium]
RARAGLYGEALRPWLATTPDAAVAQLLASLR